MTHVSSLYLHVPFCKHLCNYCDFYKKQFDQSKKQIEEFHQFLEMSLQRHEELLLTHHAQMKPLETVYLGGGTPSLWGVEGAQFFKNSILSKMPLQDSCEFTMEVDPGTWTPEMIESWKVIGLNRISIGTQSLHPDFLKIMDRQHSLQESLDLLSYCQKNKWNYSLDFLLGIPFSQEKKRDIRAELDLLLQYNPKHISLYILNARSKYPHIQNLPDDEYISAEYLAVSDYLQSKGFHHYEVSNFAKPGFESQHNLKYWRSQSVAALGSTGTGYLATSSQEGERYKWKVTSPEVEVEHLSRDEVELERMYLLLRTSMGWKPDHLTENLKKLFERWEEIDLGKFQDQRMILNQRGFIILDSLMNEIFAQQ